jgi:hypothetical protein
MKKALLLSNILLFLLVSRGSAQSSWDVTGNGGVLPFQPLTYQLGAFLGTTDNTALILRQNFEHVYSVSTGHAYTLGWLNNGWSPLPTGQYSFSIGDFKSGGANINSDYSYAIGNTSGNWNSLNTFTVGNNINHSLSTKCFAIGNNMDLSDGEVGEEHVQSFSIGNDIGLLGSVNSCFTLGNYITQIGNLTKSFCIGNNLGVGGTGRFIIGSGTSTNSLTNTVDNSLVIGFDSDIPTLVVGPSAGIGTTGNVGIGTSTPLGKLHIQDGDFVISSGSTKNFKVTSGGYLTARQIDVHVNSIPDYVFKNDYCLMSLIELGAFVSKFSHLPGIKSAEEYEKTGSVNIGELNMKLLEKVEELTLYVIQLKKENEEIKSRLNQISK